MSLRIVKVMPWFAPATQFGGVVTQAEKVCRELARRGHEVSVVTTDNGIRGAAPSGSWIERDGYRIHYAATRTWHRIPPYYSPTMADALDEALAGADVCALNVGLTLANARAAKVAERHRVPFVYNAEGALCPTRLAIKRRRKRAFVRRVERPLLARAAACQAVTRKEREDLLALGVAPERIHVIPNGIEPFRPGDAEAFRARYALDAHPVALFLGRLHAVKGVDLLVEAFAKFAPADARLVIAGPDDDGTGRRAADQARTAGIADRTVLTGHLEADARRDALSAADIFALTSHSEGLPNAVLEALAAGLPCVLTRECNVPEVEEASAGRVVPRELSEIGPALTHFLSDRGARDSAGENARQLAAGTFDLDRIVDRLEALYASIR